MNNNNPSWVNSIRNGDFQGATDALTQQAAQKIQEAQALTDMKRMAQSSQYGKYTAYSAAARVQELLNNGQIATPEQAKEAYRDALDRENAEFKATMQPGYARSTYEDLPSDLSVRDYCQMRRGLQQEQKEVGARIAQVNPNSR